MRIPCSIADDTQLIATSKWYEVTKFKIFRPRISSSSTLFKTFPLKKLLELLLPAAKDDCLETLIHCCVPNYAALKSSFVSSCKYLGWPKFDDWPMSTFCWGLCHCAGSGCPVQADKCPSQCVERKLFLKDKL